MVLVLLWLYWTFFRCEEPGHFHWHSVSSFPNHSLRPPIIIIIGEDHNSSPIMIFLRKPGSLVVVWIKSLAIAAGCSFCSGGKNQGMNFATTLSCQDPASKISDTVVFGIPRSASSSHIVSHWSLLIAACTRSTFSGVLLVVGLPERGSLSTDCWLSLKCLFVLRSLHSPWVYWIIWIVSTEACSSLTQNLMQILCYTSSFWMRWPHSTVCRWCVVEADIWNLYNFVN